MKSLKEFSIETKEPLMELKDEELLSLEPYISDENHRNKFSKDWLEKYDFSLDGYTAFAI